MSDAEVQLSISANDDQPSTVPLSDVGTTASDRTVASVSSTQTSHAVIAPGVLKEVRVEESRGSQASVHDVAAFILQRKGEMTAMKLQKLVYYSQAWSLVWDEAPLFDEPIEAWANGPVVRSLYNRHQGRFKVKEWSGDPNNLSALQQETIEKVLEFYGEMSSQMLSDLTHQEAPWREARQGLGPTDRGARVISLASMAEYYSSLK